MNATRGGEKLLNVGPKSAAWLRQVGIRSLADLAASGAVGAFVRIKRAGFRPSANLLYALEGALTGCHWQQVPLTRRSELLAEAETAIADLPQRAGRAAGVVTERRGDSDGGLTPDDAAADVAPGAPEPGEDAPGEDARD